MEQGTIWNWTEPTVPATAPEKFLDIFLLLLCFLFKKKFISLSFFRSPLLHLNFHFYNPLYPCNGESNGTPLFPVLLPGKSNWMEEPGGLQSMGSLQVGHNWATSLSLFTFKHWRRKWQPTPVFLPGEPQGQGAWWAAVYGVAQNRTRLKRLSSSSNSITMQKRKSKRNEK